MHELVLASAVIAVTISVLVGLLMIFRKWLVLREQLIMQIAHSNAMPHNAAREYGSGVDMVGSRAQAPAGEQLEPAGGAGTHGLAA